MLKTNKARRSSLRSYLVIWGGLLVLFAVITTLTILVGASGRVILALNTDQNITLQTRPVQIDLPKDSALTYMGGIEVTGAPVGVGGISALHLGALGEDGNQPFIALSDRGLWIGGKILRQHTMVSGLQLSNMHQIEGYKAGPVSDTLADAESLALASDGRFIVGFERTNRISTFTPDETGTPFQSKQHHLFRDRRMAFLHSNAGVEAMALLPNNQLLLIAEDPPSEQDGEIEGYPVWLLDQQGNLLSSTVLSKEAMHSSITAADYIDGALWLLERDFDPFRGFSIRILRLAVDVKQDMLHFGRPQEMLSLNGKQGADNAESLQLWRDPDGLLRITIATDDNFNLLQKTLLLEFSWPTEKSGQR